MSGKFVSGHQGAAECRLWEEIAFPAVHETMGPEGG
jgi:hypothetical protein